LSPTFFPHPQSLSRREREDNHSLAEGGNAGLSQRKREEKPFSLREMGWDEGKNFLEGFLKARLSHRSMLPGEKIVYH
jgi:hypothetical protein